VSMIFGDNLRKTISYTALFGAVFLLVCDLISRTLIAPYEVPIGLTVSVVGGIVFLYLILKKTKHA